MTRQDALNDPRRSKRDGELCEHLGPNTVTVAECRRRGIRLTATDSGLHFKGPAEAITPDLIKTLRSRKSEIMAALRGEAGIEAKRLWGRRPDVEIPLSPIIPQLDDQHWQLVIEYITRQPSMVVNWVCGQASRYDRKFPQWPPPTVRELAACLDCAIWQLRIDDGTRIQRITALLDSLRFIEGPTRNFDERCE